MAVDWCRLRLQGAGLKIGSDYGRTYTHEFLIHTTDPEDLMITVASGAALIGNLNGNTELPSLWDSYNIKGESDAGSFLQDISIDRYMGDDKDFKYWIARCVWKPPTKGNGADAPPAANPTLDPIRWKAESAQFTRKMTRDVVDNRLIANSAEDLYDDVERDDGRIVLTATKNIAASSFTTIVTQMREYNNAINSDTFLGATAGQAKIDSITMSDLLSRESIDYYAVTYRIQFVNPDIEADWNLRLENKGSMAFDRPKTDPGATKGRVRVLQGTNKGSFREEAYLAYDGTQLDDAAAALAYPPPANDPYRIYIPKPFAALGLV